jgi:hypothetical protein
MEEPMTRYRRPSERDQLYAVIVEMVTYQAQHHRAVLDTLAQWAKGVSAGGGGRRPVNGHSDPTGSTALLGDDDARSGRLAIDEHLSHIVRLLRDDDHLFRTVMAARDQVMPPEPADRGLAQCCNKHCPDEGAWAVKAGRCDGCYAYWRKYDRDRRASVVGDDG